MPNKWIIVEGAIVSLSIAYGIKARISAKKDAKLYVASHEMFVEEQRANEAQIKYLCHMLDRNDIPVDTFDLIVLNYNNE